MISGVFPLTVRIIRTVRTVSSERFLLQFEAGRDSAALDLHYLDNGRVSGTLVVFDDRIADSEIPSILAEIDECLLPDASLDHGNLTFTVVRGRVEGTFTATDSTIVSSVQNG